MRRKSDKSDHRRSSFISARNYLGREPSGARTAGGAIVLRKTCFFLEKGALTYPVPELTLLATRQGFRWLSRFFAQWAEKENPDEFDHDHLSWPFAPLDCRRSDEMEIPVGMITPKNKRNLFRRYGITAKNAYRGDLRGQYEAQLRKVKADLGELLRMKQQLGSC